MRVSPIDFFSHLVWIDGRPLLDVIEPYRQRLFTEAMYTFNADGTPRYNLVLAGRAKKNWKSADLILAALYRFLAWSSAQGNDAFLLANDLGQADDDLKLAKKLISVNPLLASEVDIKQRIIERRDGKGELAILPARDVTGSHGKTYLFIGYDELHGYRDYDLLEALAPDPSRLDVLTWVTTYASIHNSPGIPLFDVIKAGKDGTDPRMFFSWYAGDYCTDITLMDESVPLEVRANPSMASWNNPGYLAQQKRRLPLHKYRRLHLNLPGMPEGTAYDPTTVTDSIIAGRRSLPPQDGISYCAFVDMSGGSNDNAVLGIAHRNETGRRVLDLLVSQTGRPPFNPRKAVDKFVGVLGQYRIRAVTGDAYAGETFRSDFQDRGIEYRVSSESKSELYEALEPMLNAGEVELLDLPKLQEQALGLVWRGNKIDHQGGEHDDWINAAAGVLRLVSRTAAHDADIAAGLAMNMQLTKSNAATPPERVSAFDMPRSRWAIF